jgi:glyoxylase-like metal-dependent hydrolase (beta-lactamase superfamily II)
MAEVKVILPGYALRTNRGFLGFCTIALIRGEKDLIFDTGHWMDRHRLIEELDKNSIDPAKIHGVILSHLHADHIMNVDLFPNAELIISAKELEYVKQPHPKDTNVPFFWRSILEGRRIRCIEKEGEGEVMRDVGFLILPGHTPGCLAAVVRTSGGRVVLAGDAGKYHKEYLTRRKFDSMIYASPEEVERSIERILEVADVVIPGHDRPMRVVNKQYVAWEDNIGLELIIY